MGSRKPLGIETLRKYGESIEASIASGCDTILSTFSGLIQERVTKRNFIVSKTE